MFSDGSHCINAANRGAFTFGKKAELTDNLKHRDATYGESAQCNLQFYILACHMPVHAVRKMKSRGRLQ